MIAPLEKPFFSIILPVYNGEKYLAQSIESVLKQTEQDFELIVINDCSKDSTPHIIEEFEIRSPKVRGLHNEVNLNIARSLNRGIDAARGYWMVRLDSDDYFQPQYLEKLKKAILSAPHADNAFFSAWVSIVNERGKKILSVKLPDSKTIEKMMPIENFLYHPATAFSKKAWARVGGYPLDKKIAEDTGMWRRFFQAGLQLIMIPENLVNYRIHYSNITSVNDAKLFKDTSAQQMKVLRQNSEWRISLFLKQRKLERARREILTLYAMQKKWTLKNIQYYLLTFLPASAVYFFMWELRPRLRFFYKLLTGRHVRV